MSLHFVHGVPHLAEFFTIDEEIFIDIFCPLSHTFEKPKSAIPSLDHKDILSHFFCCFHRLVFLIWAI